jgi:hypothetical protein
VALGGLTLPNPAQAAPTPSQTIRGKGGNFGLGGSLGDPTGLSMKLFLHPNHALQWSVGWAPWHFGGGRLHMDYLWHPGAFTTNSVMSLVGYVGIGLGMLFWAYRHGYWCGSGNPRWDYDRYCSRYGDGGVAMFLRVPALGLAFHWQKVPLDTVIEAAWSPIVAPWFGPQHADFLVAARYYF